MNDFKFYGKCSNCRKKKLFVHKFTVRIAGADATSKDLMCGKCIKNLRKITKL